MLSSEFQDFYSCWLKKAREYGDAQLRGCFDKFFTLFVVYNRLYAEMTFLMVRKGKFSLRKRNTFPDSKAAKDYVQQYLGSSNIWSWLQNDVRAKEAIESIGRLIEQEGFSIKLHMVSGDRQPEEDRKLLQSLRSASEHQRVSAILDITYSIRCNMFHGHKGFNEVQVEILRPANVLLENIVRLLYQRLMDDRDMESHLRL